MASLTIQADAVRGAVTSIQTCTPTISATLKELLQGKGDENNETKTSGRSRLTKPPTATKGKPAAGARRGAQSKAQAAQNENGTDGGLAAKEKALLATQVINATLKTLGEAAKNPSAAAATIRTAAQGDLVKSTSRKALRRSTSMPMTPLQPRILNRVSTSPGAVRKTCKSPTAPNISSGCLATVECARAAFMTLRTLSNAGNITLPELQLESGMSSFVNRLLALNLYEQALKELRLLKRRLEALTAGGNLKKPKAAISTESGSSSKTLSDLLDYPTANINGPVLGLIITSQLQALHIIYGLKKSSHLDTALPFLLISHQASPLALLLLSASKGENPDRAKCARQLESLAQSLLSLTPSVSTKDDGLAVEPRLSPSPETSLEIQALSLLTRLHSWSLSGHKGDVDKDILFPLSKCLAAFTRRSLFEPISKSDVVSGAFTQILQRIEGLGLRPSGSPNAPLANIYQVLGGAAREAGSIKAAIRWTTSLKAFTNPKECSAARCCTIAAQLLALFLKQSSEVEESMINDVLDGLQGSLSGNTTELDELLVNICLVRKSAINFVLVDGKPIRSPDPIRELLEALLLQLPRFALRWLGKPPASSSASKDLLRFEQRRQLLSKYLHQILDSALMLMKVLLEAGKMPWDLMDPVLQDSLTLLENMGDLAVQNLKNNPAASHHVKISHFYYQQHLILRQGPEPKNTMFLRALRRSIDAVRQRPDAEQVKAQVLTKQERLAELCRASGRRDDAADALRSIRDTLVQEDVVTDITEALSKKSLLQAWKSNSKTESLSRTVCNLAKVDYTPCDWTWLLTGLDKTTALEHDLYFVYSNDIKMRKELVPGGKLVESILEIFSYEAYPVRRLRTLLQLLIVSLESRDEASGWLEEARALSGSIDRDNLGQDAALARYVPHLQGLAACLSALFDSEPSSPRINQAIEMWSTAVESCRSAEDLYKHIDNPPQLVTSLQSLANFARMKGLDTLLALILQLSVDVSQLTADKDPELLISQNTALCLQHLTLGHSSKVEKILETSQQYLSHPDLSHTVVAGFHLCSAEYHMALGNFEQAERNLAEAHAAATTQASEKHSKSSRITRKMAIAYAFFLHSVLDLERGNVHYALTHAKNAVRVIFHDWAKLETLRGAAEEQTGEVSQTEVSEDDSSFNTSTSSQSDITRASTGPEFWAMVYPLFRFILRLSSVYAHVGMYQETMYYAEQAQKVAISTESTAYISQSKAWLASVFLTAGKTGKALELATQVKETVLDLEPTSSTVSMICQLSRIFRDVTDHDTEMSLMSVAESMLQTLSGETTGSGTLDIEAKMEKLTIKEKPVPRTGVRQIKARTATAVRKAAPRKPAAARAKTPVEVKTLVIAKDAQLSFMRASILQHRSSSLLEKKDWPAAVAALQTAYQLSKLSSDITQERLFMAVAFIGQSLEQMGRDSVFSVIQESTLSFPAVAASLKDKTGSDRTSLTKATPPRKARAGTPDIPSFLEHLRQAQDCLLEAHSLASLNGDGRLIHRIAALLQNVFILLSTTSPTKSSGIGHPAHATCSIELARNLVWRRERKTLRADSDKAAKAEWPVLVQSSDPRRSSLGFSIDMNRFQKEYVDVIPKSWNVVSISLSDNKHDLCITKLQAGHSPFAIRLPLERASSRDADTEVFNFHQGRAEMLDIIEVANRTCHDARDMSSKGAKSAWWADREALDVRMKDLLENIEQTWLGGFKGVFAQHHRRSDLLARFQKSFQNILDKHLPSRRQVRGRRTKPATANKVSLDPRILDLFIGLGDATIPECDLDEPLTDLLYFAVDILQFHGERNAYDEVDFDSMVVETFDALHSYHAAAKSSQDGDNDVHTILVLDKSLHIFPWESLPCMQGLAVSRIPSLACLRRSILEQQSRTHAQSLDGTDDDASPINTAREGHHISLSSGTYILNPSADLKSTQTTFASPLASLPPLWTAIETRAPSELELETALKSSDLLLYFGHGSGAQYIRGRTIRKMEKCRAVALLMGCSSASLADVGEFESHGPVWNYMLAGSPAVVGTLWDVTDRDIDRYAGRVFEEWGLMERGTFAEDGAASEKGKGKGKASAAVSGRGRKKEKASPAVIEDEGDRKTSLVEAVAKARDACRFRYLTAAAVVVYGIPVYIDK
ncbi:peptidase family C50-domain-containing protein [Xylariales sp. AK1849]|nr:peptidase family C50-domain-containing protein [Xylariales sp. AK1849]